MREHSAPEHFSIPAPVESETRAASTDPETRVSSPAPTNAQGERARTGRRALTGRVRARHRDPRVGREGYGEPSSPSSA